MSKKKNKDSANSPVILNRKARGEFEIIETLVAGIELRGTEVKSIRLSRVQLKESFVKFSKNSEAFLYGMTIAQYEFGNIYNHDPDRTRKLLLNKKEIIKWKSKIERENLTIVPLKLFFIRSHIKLEIAMAKRKQLHDKRKELHEKAIDRDTKREIKSFERSR